MDRDCAVRCLASHRPQLQAMGIRRMSLFGSTARGEATATSDVDIAIMLDEHAGIDLFRFAALRERVSQLIEAPVDLVVEPARNPRMQAEIDRDRLGVY